MSKPKIKHTITKKEWNKKHKDFKLMGKDGIPYIMMYDDKIGTHLVPVKIIEATDAEETEFHTKLDTLVHNTFGKSPEEMEESVGAELDLIKQSSKDVRDFIKKVFSNSDFRDMKSDKDFLKYLKSIYEGINEMGINDPIMIKLRAAQMKRNKDAAKKVEKEKKINPDYKALKNATKIKALKKKRAEVMRDMEQEAEPEGGKIADRYGKLLNRIDNDIIKLGGNPMSEGMVKPKSGHTYYQLTKDFPVKYITGKYGMGLEVPGVLIKNKSGYIDGKKGAYLIDYFDALYYVDMKKKFASPVYSLRDQDKFSRGSITQIDMAPDYSDWKRYIKESVNENDGVYFKSYTAAIEAARAAALKKGFEVDDDEMFTKVGMNSKRPSVGKTTRVSLELTKAGKPQRKMLHIQVYGMKNGYELNSYIN